MRPGEDELRELYHGELLTCKQIAGRFGVTEQTVGRWLRKFEIKLRPQNLRQQGQKYPGREEMRRLYLDERKSLRQIAEELNTFIPVVSRWLKRAGIQSRSISEGTSMAQTGRPLSEAHKESLRKSLAVARTKVTDESREKWRQKMVGREPPNKGKPMSEEQRQKLLDAWQDPERREKMAALRRGEKSHLWKGGVTPDSSLHGWRWRALRRLVYARDKWLCQDCGVRCLNTKDSRSKPKLKIQAHHILPRRYGGTDELDNLVTLCMSCHHKRERAYKEGK